MKKRYLAKLAYRPEEAAHLLSVSRATVYRMIDDGTLRRVRLPERSCCLITAESLTAVVEQETED